MNIELLDKIDCLKSELIKAKEYKNLKISEKRMEDNEEVQLLSYKKDMAIVKYEDDLKVFIKGSKELAASYKEMTLAIYRLNNHPLVVAYNKDLDAYNFLIKEISSNLFGFLK